MAKELAHFKNFAKLKDTSVEFNDITVLAGKPGTGKSYVMKMIYTINEAVLLGLDEYNTTKESIFKNINNDKFIESKYKELNGKPISKDELEKAKLFISSLKESLDDETYEFTMNDELIEISLNQNIKNISSSVFTNSNQIAEIFSINYFGLGVDINKSSVKVALEKNSILRSLHSSSEAIFVETPLILEFHKHLDRRKAKTPYHIESLINILDEDYSFTDEEQDELIRNFSKKANSIIGGDIKNRNGSFVFSRNDDKDYNIFNASSGIKSIGLLQYLVTNKALKKGSVLFWEEPEVHLHPEWQLKMVELFVELMNAGVKIVFSTHSPYMADYLNAISKKRKISERVSFNLLQEKDGVVTNYILKDKKDWKKIQTELLDPLEEIMWEYL